jgi:hypothetical protein
MTDSEMTQFMHSAIMVGENFFERYGGVMRFATWTGTLPKFKRWYSKAYVSTKLAPEELTIIPMAEYAFSRRTGPSGISTSTVT